MLARWSLCCRWLKWMLVGTYSQKVEDEVDDLESSESLPMKVQHLEQQLVVVLQVVEVELLHQSLEALRQNRRLMVVLDQE